jgi:EAL domain-containing protein (putative c-di-GMP-specific phosphodiesterase class I)
VDVRASIGIAPAESNNDTPEALLRRADVAMYTAKRAGSGYALYASEADQNSPEHLALASELRRAIAEDQLELHYQPKLDLRTGRIHSVEALVRWRHPQRGLLNPADFIGLAESIGLIDELSEWVLNAAGSQCRTWRNSGNELAVAVNLSARNLPDPRLPQTVAALLGTYGLVPESLILELTESTLLEDSRRALTVVGALRQIGVRMSIDDFGTGYSSLVHLKQLPVDELKIDQTFVRHLATNANDAAIVRSTIALAHDLGLTVVAEGVEDQRACELLAGYGCDVVQGYYIGRPVPVEQVPELVKSIVNTSPALLLAA